jgi:hypothetical protein
LGIGGFEEERGGEDGVAAEFEGGSQLLVMLDFREFAVGLLDEFRALGFRKQNVQPNGAGSGPMDLFEPEESSISKCTIRSLGAGSSSWQYVARWS